MQYNLFCCYLAFHLGVKACDPIVKFQDICSHLLLGLLLQKNEWRSVIYDNPLKLLLVHNPKVKSGKRGLWILLPWLSNMAGIALQLSWLKLTLLSPSSNAVLLVPYSTPIKKCYFDMEWSYTAIIQKKWPRALRCSFLVRGTVQFKDHIWMRKG